jgi:hypothetical protein
MFKDLDGNPMDIEVRGEKTEDGLYFKSYVIGKTFDYDRVNDII